MEIDAPRRIAAIKDAGVQYAELTTYIGTKYDFYGGSVVEVIGARGYY